ncbi:MAG: SPFH domain-containing protein [Oscillospiraceae bacterium]|nr:SPFH domain-containing protein [Oscillospiraceae bacterium]
MGLIRAAIGATSGVLADQWKEYFYYESMPANVLAVKGMKKVSGRTSNFKGDENIITNGSIIAVADGQCMIIVDQGKVTELCAEPGEYTYDMSTEPSLFDGGRLASNLRAVFDNIGKRFTFGGEAPKDQRIYYFNTKELTGNKYGTPNAIPFRVVDERAGIDIDVNVRCFGEYSYRITNPLLFYQNVCSNITDVFTREEIDGQLKSELLTKLQPAFARISTQGIRYSALPGHTAELAAALKEELSAQWSDGRGIEIEAVGVSSIKADEEDEKMMKELQRNAAFTDPSKALAYMVGASGAASQIAAGNAGGAALGFMNMNAAQMAGGMNAQSLVAALQAQQPAAPAAGSWMCACGTANTGNFCSGCGAAKPVAAAGWNCTACGAVNQGRFCSNCGAAKPAGVPQYKCDKCGWVPEDPTKAPKFCPNCGDPFGDEDRI